MKYLVYKISNKINDKCYIGCTNQGLNRRLKQHLNPKNKQTHFTLALAKYGIDNFLVEVIETLSTNDEMLSREMYWISYYNSNNRKVGYNSTIGGDRGPTFIGKDHPNFGKPSTNPKWQEIIYRNLGKKMTEDHRNKFCMGNIGRVRSEETKKRMSEAQKNSVYRQNMPKEVCQKISDAKRGVKNHKRPMVLCLNNYKVYDTYKDAAKALGVTEGNIPQVVNGKYSHTKGYRFQRVIADHLIF